MSTFSMVASMNESTVVAVHTPQSRRSDSYQSEADLEKEFIRMLTEQGYDILNSVKTFGNIVCFRNLEECDWQAYGLF